MHYEIVCSNSIEKLKKMVQDAINSGWRPLGSPFLMNDGTIGQAIIKNKEVIYGVHMDVSDG